jgi:hypothetical protein
MTLPGGRTANYHRHWTNTNSNPPPTCPLRVGLTKARPSPRTGGVLATNLSIGPGSAKFFRLLLLNN